MSPPPAAPSAEVAQRFLSSFATALTADNGQSNSVPVTAHTRSPKPRKIEPKRVDQTSEQSSPSPPLLAKVKPRRRLTPQRVTTATAANYDNTRSPGPAAAVEPLRFASLDSSSTASSNISQFRAAEKIISPSPFQSAALPDPFSRPLSGRSPESSASLLSSSEFPSLGTSSSLLQKPNPESGNALPEPLNLSAEPTPEPDQAALEAAIAFHAACVRAVPRLLVSAIRALLDNAVSPVDNDERLSNPVVGILHSRASLVKYSRAVLVKLTRELSLLPAPIVSAFSACDALPMFPLLSPSVEYSFPSIDGNPWSPLAAHISEKTSPAVLPHRLSCNLEAVWDDIVVLQRRFRGDVSGVAPGVLDARAAVTAMGRLHPAAVDLLAVRFLGMVTDAALTARDGAPVKMRQLGARLRGAGGVQQFAGGRVTGSQREKGGGVVLHRLPEVVRWTFADDPMQLFVLDFLTVVDSARLLAALMARVATALNHALRAAAAATTNSAFTDAVVDARLFARLLALTMHTPNWAHSEHTLEGAIGVFASKGETRGLDRQALAFRASVCSAMWTAAFDLSGIVKSAVDSGQTLAIIAAVSVADVLLRLAVVDPIGRATEWYAQAVRSVRDLCIGTLDRWEDGKEENQAVTMPLVDIMVGELLENNIGIEKGLELSPRNGIPPQRITHSNCGAWTAIGDIRFIQECCPSLDELRRKLIAPHSECKRQRPIARRITPLATENSAAVSSLSKCPEFPSSSTSISKPQVNEGRGKAASSEPLKSDNLAGDLDDQLRREFYRRMDGRLRELIGVVAASRPTNEASAVQAYSRVANLLYPGTPQTVVAVAAHFCANQVERQQMEINGVGVSKDKGRGAGFKGVGGRNNTGRSRISAPTTSTDCVAFATRTPD